MNKDAQDQLLGTALSTATKLGLSAIPGIGGVLSQVASPFVDQFIGSKLQEASSSRAYNNLGTATTQTNNPYMKYGGNMPVTKVWAKYGSVDNLKKKLQQGGYLQEGGEITPDMVSMMEQDLANQGGQGMAMQQESDMGSMTNQEQQPMQEEGNMLAQYSDEQLQQILQALQGKEDEESIQMMQMIAQELQSRQQQPTQEAQPMQQEQMLKYGGAIVGMPDLMKYIGKTHEQGGILVDAKGIPTNNETNAVAEVEKNETNYNNYIFSDTLKV